MNGGSKKPKTLSLGERFEAAKQAVGPRDPDAKLHDSFRRWWKIGSSVLSLVADETKRHDVALLTVGGLASTAALLFNEASGDNLFISGGAAGLTTGLFAGAVSRGFNGNRTIEGRIESTGLGVAAGSAYFAYKFLEQSPYLAIPICAAICVTAMKIGGRMRSSSSRGNKKGK